MGRKKIIILILLILAIVFLVYFFGNAHLKPVPVQRSLSEVNVANVASSQPRVPIFATMAKVIDADTIFVTLNNTDTSVNLIGIVIPSCFAEQANIFTQHLLPTGSTVSLQSDSEQPRDTSDDISRYVYAGDIFINEEMIQDGYALAATSSPYQYQSEFEQGQAYAQAGGIGLWADASCENQK